MESIGWALHIPLPDVLDCTEQERQTTSPTDNGNLAYNIKFKDYLMIRSTVTAI